MRTVLVILFGLALGATGVIVGVYLGLVLNGPPDWKTGAKVLLILAITQCIAFVSFQRRVALQVLLGVALSLGAALAFLLTSLPLFWEQEDQPHVYSITWRSSIAFAIMVLLSQAASYAIFRLIRLGRRKSRAEMRAS